MFLRKLLTSNAVIHKLQCLPHMRCISVSSVNFCNKDPLDLSSEKMQKFLESLRMEFYDLRVNAASSEAKNRMHRLNGVVSALEQQRALQHNLTNKEDIETEKDEDMRQLLREENEVYSELLRKTEAELIKQMLTLAEDEQYNSLIFEVNAGAGGQEAMLFAKELFDMYTNFFEYNDWRYDIIEQDETDIGGLRHGNVIVQDSQAYNELCYEAGVHRVQRVPTTEKSGRIHTSTASIAVIPRPDDVQITLLDKDLKIETKRASGAGGQHVNTTDSAVRVVHLPTGLAVECQTERSQIKNRERALQRLQAKLLQLELERNTANTQKTRKAQQGNLNRNEKIRTYNFVQDRITDHRISNGTVHNLKEFLEGSSHLGRLIQRVAAEHKRAKLAEMVAKFDVESAKSASEN